MRDFVKCRCCLEDGELREMWSEYAYKGGSEVYGAMLLECFSLQLRSLADCTEYICETCVERLRGAYNFRQSVINAQQVWDRMIEENENEKAKNVREEKYDIECSEAKTSDSNNYDAKKSESSDYDAKKSESSKYRYEIEIMMAESQDEQEGDQSVEEPQTKKPESVDDDSEDGHQGDGDHKDDNGDNDTDDDDFTMDTEYLDDLSEEDKPKRKKRKIVLPKIPKRKPRERSYKQYTRDDMLKAIKAILEKKMTRAQASRVYNIPSKTLSTKFKTLNIDPSEMDSLEVDDIKLDSEDEEAQTKRIHFYEEILTILHFTNATPYKFRSGKLYCAYCFTEGLEYENRDCDELRKHTKIKHADIQLDHVRDFMKPYYLNETVKLDINNLRCTVCPKKLDDWNGMFKHLVEVHDAEFDQAYSKVIPFKLGKDNICALCQEKFPHYQKLDIHMNAHYANYICGECGGTYLSESRLKKHETIHSTSKFPCQLCNRVFSLDKYRRKHLENVHVRRERFNCKYCPEKFHQAYKRHLHITEKHPEKLVTYNCDYCGSSFTWKAYYMKHVRLQHQTPDKKHQCKICARKFNQRHELRNHLEWHLGHGYTCVVCDTKFCSKSYLQKHMATHDEDESVVLALKLVKSQAV